MLHGARLLALFFLSGLTISISAQSLKPVPAQVQRVRELGAAFTPIMLFEKTPASDASAARFAQGAQFLSLDANRLAGLLADHPKSIALAVPFNDEILKVDLILTDIQSADFKVTTSESQSEPAMVRPGLHYRGILHGNEHSIAAVSFFENDVIGVVADDLHGNLVLGKVQRPDNQTAYICYADNELAMDNPFECNLIEETSARPLRTPSETERADSGRSIRIYLESNYALFRDRGSVQATADYLAAMFNQVAALYANEEIEMTLIHIMVGVTPDGYAGLGSDAILERFRKNRIDTNADLSHLIGLAGNNQESAAYLDALCQPEYTAAFSNINISYSKVPTYSWAAEVMAHEIGHNLGARHTQWCGWPGGAIDPCQLAEAGCTPSRETRSGSTIMSYCPLITSGINFSNGLGALPGSSIRSALNASPCLTRAKSNIKTADNRTTTVMPAESMNLTPNPANKQVNVQLNYAPESQIRIALLDLVGRTLHTEIAARGDAAFSVDLSNLQKGIYLVQVFENDQLVATKRLIKN